MSTPPKRMRKSWRARERELQALRALATLHGLTIEERFESAYEGELLVKPARPAYRHVALGTHYSWGRKLWHDARSLLGAYHVMMTDYGIL